MDDANTRPRGGFRREHPVFFWGTAALIGLLVAATAAVATTSASG